MTDPWSRFRVSLFLWSVGTPLPSRGLVGGLGRTLQVRGAGFRGGLFQGQRRRGPHAGRRSGDWAWSSWAHLCPQLPQKWSGPDSLVLPVLSPAPGAACPCQRRYGSPRTQCWGQSSTPEGPLCPRPQQPCPDKFCPSGDAGAHRILKTKRREACPWKSWHHAMQPPEPQAI